VDLPVSVLYIAEDSALSNVGESAVGKATQIRPQAISAKIRAGIEFLALPVMPSEISNSNRQHFVDCVPSRESGRLSHVT